MESASPKGASPKGVMLAICLLIVSPVVAVGAANANAHLPDCKANSRCLLYAALVAAEKWDKIRAIYQSFTPADMQAMIDSGADVKASNESGWTPLHSATAANARDAVEPLLRHGADVHAKNQFAETPLHLAGYDANTRDVAELLLRHGADVNARAEYGLTPLHNAAFANARDTAELLLRHGADVNARSEFDETPLDRAVGFHADETAALLRAHGAIEAAQ